MKLLSGEIRGPKVGAGEIGILLQTHLTLSRGLGTESESQPHVLPVPPLSSYGLTTSSYSFIQ